MIAHLRQIRISSNKANLVAGMVRGMPVNKALDLLKFTPKKAAHFLYKVIDSAAANAENNFKQNRDQLVIKEIIVNEGSTFKRFQPVSRGRGHPILKRTAHISVKVGISQLDATRPPKVKKASKVPHGSSAAKESPSITS
mgnify:CR=1 FL=1